MGDFLAYTGPFFCSFHVICFCRSVLGEGKGKTLDRYTLGWLPGTRVL